MTRSALDRLKDIIQASGSAYRYAAGLDPDRLMGAGVARDGALFQLMIIGEAATHLPTEVQALAPDIPWSQIRATRHKIAHGYWQIDFDVIADTITSDLRPLELAAMSLVEVISKADP
ncbi:DUF86 domain-containing protein [Xanthobacteraceae bacterium Astr-EGSB]|uniref:HepT-like ribonuclease domain-containing protein n=1 Tax=Astrobacterium formosum TaxID=3069710 RepID=UPI0027AE0E5B|nr:DUF86 domain-containing protein [Xanthobacteraceae bacterium Astr-EGSB]